LHASEGRDTKALNCKPITNLKEKMNFQINDLHASDGRDTEALNCKPITNL
jgi:hypothetical protein